MEENVGKDNKMTYSKKASIMLLILLLVVMVIFVISVFTTLRNKTSDIGVLAVKYMYNFQTIGELDDNMEPLKVITTPEVYNQLTMDRTDKALNVYLKFEGNPVTVNVEEVTDSYVIYSLNTKSVSSFRKFVFFYHVGKNGKIDQAREGELLDFVNSRPSG